MRLTYKKYLWILLLLYYFFPFIFGNVYGTVINMSVHVCVVKIVLNLFGLVL